MKRLLRILKRLSIFLLVLAAIGTVVFLVLDKPLPKGQSGPEAEQMADKMLAAVGIHAWDSLRYLAWDSPRSNSSYAWDRKNDYVLATKDGIATMVQPRSGKPIGHTQRTDLKDDAAKQAHFKQVTQSFWNDSFWLEAFTKVRDEGTSRQVVDLEEGEKGLLVTYASGGVTPGDSYLWILDANFRPVAWRLWTQRLPLGGAEFSWAKWDTLPGGAWYATEHQSTFFTISQARVRGGDSAESIGFSANMFAELEAVLSSQN
jgi:hypothetical protein